MFMTAFFTMVKNLEEQVLYVPEKSGIILDNKFLCMLSLQTFQYLHNIEKCS